jgi:hypothetical protein
MTEKIENLQTLLAVIEAQSQPASWGSKASSPSGAIGPIFQADRPFGNAPALTRITRGDRGQPPC